MSDLNGPPRSHNVTDPTACAWPVQEIATAETPATTGTGRYVGAAAHAMARVALRELRQETGNAGAAVAPARPVPAPLTSMSPMGVAAPPASSLSSATPLRKAGETAETQTGPGWISGIPVLLLVDDGHNGTDTLLAGGLLAHGSCAVSAVLAAKYPYPVALERAHDYDVTIHGAGYHNDDGTGQDSAEAMTAIETFLVHGGLILDGLTGIGVTGVLQSDAATLIAPLIAAGESGRRPLRVITVNLPSGTDVDDGTMSGPVLAANHTVTFICLKKCQCLPPARHLCDVVEVVPLGLPAPMSRPLARRPVDGTLGDYLTRAVDEPGPGNHKHARDVVGLWAGSESYPGAAALVASDVVRAGASMVRPSAPRYIEDLVLAARPEVVPATGRVRALVLGPGINPADTARADEVQAVLASTLGPCGKDRQCPTRILTVVDAGALSILPKSLTKDLTYTPLHVLTPHAGEAAALLIALGDQRTPVQETRHWSHKRAETHPRLAACEIYRRVNTTVLLKGATTLIAAPQQPLASVDGGPSWMATTGNGDVLAGILKAILAGAAVRWEQGIPDASGAGPVPDVLIDSVAAGIRLHAPTGAYATTSPQGAGGVRTGRHPIAALSIATALDPTRLELNWLQAVSHI